MKKTGHCKQKKMKSLPIQGKKKLPRGEVVTKRRFAILTGQSERNISRWEKEGLPSVRAGSGSGGSRGGNRINTADGIAWLRDRDRKQETGGDPNVITLEREKLRLITEQANEKALSNAKERGDVIAAEHVHEIMMIAAAQLAGALSGVPGRIANGFGKINTPAECRQAVKTEIDQARTRYADALEEFADLIEAATVNS
jgi:phage terminase Nu1 subunit (DNA packaging protein)